LPRFPEPGKVRPLFRTRTLPWTTAPSVTVWNWPKMGAAGLPGKPTAFGRAQPAPRNGELPAHGGSVRTWRTGTGRGWRFWSAEGVRGWFFNPGFGKRREADPGQAGPPPGFEWSCLQCPAVSSGSLSAN